MAGRSAAHRRRRREAPPRPTVRKSLSAEGAIVELARRVQSTSQQKHESWLHGKDKLGSTATTRRVQESLPGINISLNRSSTTSRFQTRVIKFWEQIVQKMECSPQQLFVSTPCRKQHQQNKIVSGSHETTFWVASELEAVISPLIFYSCKRLLYKIEQSCICM